MSVSSTTNTQQVPASPDSERSAGTALWLLILIMVVTIAPLIVLSQAIAYWRTDTDAFMDDQMFGYFGWRIAHGATIYVDIWDNKPPGIYWINALGFLVGNDSYLGVIALCALALVVSHVAFFVIAASVYHRGAAALTTILLSFYLTHAHYMGGTNRTEVFLVACELVGVAFYMRGWAHDRWWKWYAAGLFCGLAFLLKQVGLIGWGAMGLHLIVLVASCNLALRDGLKRCLLLAGGVGTAIAAACVVLWWQGALGEAIYAVFGFNRAYFTSGNTRFPYNIVNLYLLRTHVKPILLAPMLMAAAATLHAFLWWRRPQDRPPEIERPLQALRPVCPKSFFMFFVWYIVSLYGALIGPGGFRHYLIPTIPPLMLLAGYLINVLRAEARLYRWLQRRAWIAVGFVLLGYFSLEALWLQLGEAGKVWISRFERGEESMWETVGQAVARITGPEEKIQCLGFQSGVYMQSRRINACRFATTEKVGQVGPEADFIVRELEETLRADPPALLVIPPTDLAHMQGKGKPSPFIKLWPWIEANYHQVEGVPEFGSVCVFRRNDLGEP